MSVASMDLRLALSFSLVASLASQSGPPDLSSASSHVTTPWIREASFGQSLGIRAAALTPQHLAAPGPADLVHWGRHYGEWLSRYQHNEFAPPTEPLHAKDDGYVGYYHYCNGVDYSGGAPAIEAHVTAAIGLEKRNGGYFWRLGTDVAALGTHTSRPMVVTLCAYNVFGHAELRVRVLVTVPKSRKMPVSVDFLYSVTQQALRRVDSYTKSTLGAIPALFWTELAVSSVIRLFFQIDDPSRMVCGTVAMSAQIERRGALLRAVDRVVALLPRGHLTGMREMYGATSSSGEGSSTAYYRNRLVDTLVRLVLLDISGFISSHAIQNIQDTYGTEYDVVVCLLLRTQHAHNNDTAFLTLVHTHLTADASLTQAALLMVEQVRFLIGRGSYATAERVAARAVALLPLDFDAWLHLALCHVLSHKFEMALHTINALPVVFTKTSVLAEKLAADAVVDGVHDWYALCYMQRQSIGADVLLATFQDMFPLPKTESGADAGSVAALWSTEFERRPNTRHPISGAFCTSPLASASPIEVLAVDSHIVKVCGPGSPRNLLAARSSGNPWTSLDFDRTSTWGRTYDLVTMVVALIGWDNLVHARRKAFRKPETTLEYVVDHATCAGEECEPWLDQLLLVVYGDIRAMAAVSDDSNRSALAWEMLGMLGWACKYNLKDSVSALVTSVAGVAQSGGFDYFGTTRLLEIYNEFVLSDVDALSIDRLSCVYDGRSYSNRLIVQSVSPAVLDEFARQLVLGYLSLEHVLLHLMKYVSWNLRWYQYVPNHLATTTLLKLCVKHDFVYIRLMVRVVYETFKVTAKKPVKFSVQGFFGKRAQVEQAGDFADSDTVVEYMERLLRWIETLGEVETGGNARENGVDLEHANGSHTMHTMQ